MSKLLKSTLTFIIILTNTQLGAQDTAKQVSNPLSISGFAEAYYSYDFNKPVNNTKPFFIYSHNRHNEFNINLAYVKASYNSEYIRGNLTLAAGTYMNANYDAEPASLKNIYEANAGFKISRKKKLWIDAGILPSHIGFESARSSDCWNLTRSIIADNSPYFEGGAKLSYTSNNNKWMISALALNGWQRIQRVPGNSLMSWGTQLQYKPSGQLTLNYSTFAGTDKPDSTRQFRHFHNLYGIYQLNSKWGIIIDFDIGQEQKTKHSNDYNTWYGGAGILRFAPDKNWAFAVRGEYYDDEKGVIIPTGTENGFKVWGVSANLDRNFNDHLLGRLEFRTMNSKDEIYAKENGLVNSNIAITTSLAISF